MEITLGDIFEGEGVVVIPVNEYFDGSLGDHVSVNTLHGFFIKNVLGGQSDAFFDLTSKALKSIESEEVLRTSGRGRKYLIGTVTSVDVNKKQYLLAALSQTDISTLKASATVNELWDCLAGAWRGARNYSNGDCVRIPLSRHFPANLQIHGNRIYIAPPRELHSLRSPPMTRLWRADHVRKAIWQRFPPSRHTSPVFSTLPSISSAYAGTGLRRRSSIKAKIFWNKIFDTATSASWNVT